jgi:hypothetical protein
MQTLNDKIIQIKGIFEDIAQAIKSKGVELSECTSPAEYPDKIREISGNIVPFPNILCDTEYLVFDSTTDIKNIKISFQNGDNVNPNIIYIESNNWIQTTSNPEGYSVSVIANDSIESRIAKIIFSCTNEIGVYSHTIVVVQKGKIDIPEEPEILPVSITVEPEELDTFVSYGGNITVAVTYTNATNINEPSIQSQPGISDN